MFNIFFSQISLFALIMCVPYIERYDVDRQNMMVAVKEYKTENDHGRGERIWTPDILVPNQARYQAALHPEQASYTLTFHQEQEI